MSAENHQPGPPPRPLSFQTEFERRRDEGMTKWDQARSANLIALAESVSAEKVKMVLDALFERSQGVSVEQTRVGKDGKPVKVYKDYPPNTTAAKLWLQYAVGPPRGLEGTGESKTPIISEEALLRLAKIARKFGKDIRRVEVREVVDGAAKEVTHEHPQDPGTAGPPSGG